MVYEDSVTEHSLCHANINIVTTRFCYTAWHYWAKRAHPGQTMKLSLSQSQLILLGFELGG